MNGDMSEFARRQERFRAMMIGLALGDATLAPDGETLLAGAATDLAMRQLHALIRAWRPADSRAESTLIQATIEDLQSFVYNTDEPTSVQLEPRPWFAANPLFHKRRGNPRATVEAVNEGLKYFGGTSKGVHGLLRAAPLSALWLNPTVDELKEMVSMSVCLTHDMDYVANPSILFCMLLARLATSPTPERLDVIVNVFGEAPVTKVDAYFTTAGGEVDLEHLRTIASNGRAHRVLAAAIYLATCEVDLEGAIDFARQTADPDGVAAVAGALIGASTGVTPWMDLQFAKHEYAWQMEVLVRDLFVAALTADEPLVAMVVRYPGW